MAFTTMLLDGYTSVLILAIAAVTWYCWRSLSVRLEPGEPPLLKPTIPYIGHLIGLAKDQTAKYPVPIGTLPMINNKAYVINSPLLIQSALRSKDLSYDPFIQDSSEKLFALADPSTMKIFRAPGTLGKPALMDEFNKEMHGSMLGEHLHKMNRVALLDIAASVNAIGEGFEAKSLYRWVRSVMTIATTDSLLGSHNPIKADPTLVDLLWDYEGGVTPLLMGIPKYWAPKGYEGRAAVQAALIKYYEAKYDLEPDVAEMTKMRAKVFRKYGITDAEVARLEIGFLHVAVSNAIPTCFWLLSFIASSPVLTASIRDELMAITTINTLDSGKKEAVIDNSKFLSDCPVFVSAYRETIRRISSLVIFRRIMQDTTVSDGDSSYLLKGGKDVAIAVGVSHMNPANWGSNVAQFDAERFLHEKEMEKERVPTKAYFPFSGGKHLCPGMHFAFTEILGTSAPLVLGFDIEATDGTTLKVPKIGRSTMAEAVTKPEGEGLEMGAKFTKRKGWEGVTWRFSLV
ncbi:Lanosterol 14-alpha demethylase [Lachnellula willkommii]|uniref:Lanosterol 14-alpha demethylase n=1 Tax=Lachnellula willkommii TaxID=215461 RepID=A0A559MFS7_9HELO|nr:Lanosterol 14-alpha demethylase [Lachnellula willkommii]